MARKFSGKYSPPPNGSGSNGSGTSQGGVASFHGKTPQYGRTRINLLFFAGLPLLFGAFAGGAVGTAVALLAYAFIALSGWLTRAGLEAEEAYNARDIARRPAIPRKIFGAAFMGLGVGLATIDTTVMDSILYGAIAIALHLTAFGLDPLRDKAVQGIDGFQNDRVARAVDEAEKHLSAMHAAITPLFDRDLTARIESFQQTARNMFRTVENDPHDLAASRRYMGVYLLGARDATSKFAKLYSQSRKNDLRKDYVALLDDLEANFVTKHQELLNDNRTDFDIETDVLRERLQRDGISLK